jgi:hypothetical protein
VKNQTLTLQLKPGNRKLKTVFAAIFSLKKLYSQVSLDCLSSKTALENNLFGIAGIGFSLCMPAGIPEKFLCFFCESPNFPKTGFSADHN